MPDRLLQIHKWLQDRFNTTNYQLTAASEDASFRRYWRLLVDEKNFIVMDAPPAHERCEPFIEIAQRLRKAGVNVPEILGSDIESGLVLLTDLGDTLYLDELSDESAERLYIDAMTALHLIQQNADMDDLAPFNEEALLAEMRLFMDWLLIRHLDIQMSANEQDAMEETFRFLISNAIEQPKVFVHRDYHSRNLMVTASNNPGILDFQDAVSGPLTYDLVSLLKDCYIKWPAELVYDWALMFYRQLPEKRMKEKQFIRAFDLMGVQRHLKASGIFARLYHRDGKAGFIRDIPRTLSYITDLECSYPELIPLVTLIRQKVIPRLEYEGEKTGG